MDAYFLRRLALLVALALSATRSPAQDTKPLNNGPVATWKPATTGKHPWTLPEALRELQRRPDDVYLQFVAVQLFRNAPEKEKAKVREKLSELFDERSGRRGQRSADLFSMFSGAHAVHESLQLDTLLPGTGLLFEEEAPAPKDTSLPKSDLAPRVPAQAQVAPKAAFGLAQEAQEPKQPKYAKAVPARSLQGPMVKSHPWAEMLKGRAVDVSRLSRSVPENFYFAEFRSTDAFFRIVDEAQDWTKYYAVQGVADAVEPRTRNRLKTQMLLRDDPVTRVLLRQAVGGLAWTGSDLFVNEGSDVTLLLDLKLPGLFREQVKRDFADALSAFPHARATEGTHLGVAYRGLSTPDGTVRVFSADPRPDLHVRSNSLSALKRILEAIHGKDERGQAVPTLGQSSEFRYIRTLMPQGAAEEDGFLYLSDAFVRHMVGPALKLTERRRIIGFHHLRMITFAAQHYLTQFGAPAKTLDDLVRSGCLPASLVSPLGGIYSLSADGLTGICSVLGSTHFLTPCRDLPLPDASPAEAEAYDDFVRDYSEYWKKYFDPIAVRVQATDRKLRAETLILPLMDNSIYDGLAAVLGGETQALDRLPVPAKNLFSLNLKLNKSKIVEMLERQAKEAEYVERRGPDPAQVASCVAALAFQPAHGTEWAPQMHLYYTPPERRVPYAVTRKVPETIIREVDGKKVTQTVYRDVVETHYRFVPTGSEYRVSVENEDDPPPLRARRDRLAEWTEWYDKRMVEKLKKFFLEGMGDQIGIHFYDQRIMFDVNWSWMLGEALAAPASGRGNDVGAHVAMEVFPNVFAAGGFFTPLYLSCTVKDERIVDEFLREIDELIKENRHHLRNRSFGIDYGLDDHTLVTKGNHKARAFGLKIGPLRYRMYLARIGDGLYLTNQPDVIDDLHKALAERTKAMPRDDGPHGHALARLRPRSWNEALPGYRLAWAENNREACQANMHLLNQLARAHGPLLQGDAAEKAKTLLALARRVHHKDLVCPDGGSYRFDGDGRVVRCTCHGTLDAPVQRDAPEDTSPIAQLMRRFHDLSASLTFTGEGLRAVVTIERRP